MQKGSLFILSAPSGGGKSSLAKALVDSNKDISVSISHTTRQPRPGEENGVHYFFVSPEEFDDMVKNESFIEYAEVFGNHYGTSRLAVEEQLQQGAHVLLDIDWQGMREIKSQWADAVSIFILPPSRQELENRLCDRGQDSEDEVANRMKQAVSEMRHYDEFDYVVINDDFDLAYRDINTIIHGHPEQVRAMTVDIESLLVD